MISFLAINDIVYKGNKNNVLESISSRCYPSNSEVDTKYDSSTEWIPINRSDRIIQSDCSKKQSRPAHYEHRERVFTGRGYDRVDLDNIFPFDNELISEPKIREEKLQYANVRKLAIL